MNARERLRIMIRDTPGSMTVWSKPEIDDAFAAYDAELLTANDITGEAWPGELGHLRALLAALNAAVQMNDLRAAQRLLAVHYTNHGRPQPASTPDFFQPGHTYTHRDGTDFQCVAVTTHPQSGERLAMGWHIDSWGLHYPTTVGINQWRHEYDGVQAPTSAEGGAE